MNTPKISIITPTYNRAYILNNAIDSVVSQTYPHWEYLIVDDGSTDNTSQLITKYKDHRIRYLKQTNAGHSSARNTGLNHATGEWIAYLDSDNELSPDYMSVVVSRLNRSKHTTYALPKAFKTLELYQKGQLVNLIEDSEEFPDNIITKDIFTRKFHCDGNGFIHHKKFIKLGVKWDENLNAMPDWDFCMQIITIDPQGFLYIPKILLNYHQRFGGDGIVSNTSYLTWVAEFEHIYRKHQHHTLMKGQTWYPERVKRYRQLANLEKRCQAPSPALKHFPQYSTLNQTSLRNYIQKFPSYDPYINQ